jgi:hypothetical protein
MRRALAAAALSCLAAPAAAQVNIEPVADRVSDPGWSASLKGSLGFASGNSDFLDIGGDALVAHRTAHPRAAEDDGHAFRDRTLLQLNTRLLRAGEGDFVNHWFVHLRHTHMATLRAGVEVFGQLGDNRRLLQRWRVLGGAGGRFILADHERLRLWLGVGAMLEWEDREIDPAFDDPRYELDWRGTSYVGAALVLAPDTATLTNTVYLQPRLDDPADLQVLDELKLDLKITEAVSWFTTLAIRHDARPPADLAPTDLVTRNGIAISL